MPACENCNAQVLPDATFCEACGHKLGTTPASKIAEESGAQATPGSLRSELAFLSGTIDQAKARIDQWKQKGDQSKRAAEIQAEQQRAAEEEARQEKRKKRGPLQAVLQFLAGLAALAAFVYLLIRLPRNASPTLVLQLWASLQEEFGLE
jgi:hypothetical protein